MRFKDWVLKNESAFGSDVSGLLRNYGGKSNSGMPCASKIHQNDMKPGDEEFDPDSVFGKGFKYSTKKKEPRKEKKSIPSPRINVVDMA